MEHFDELTDDRIELLGHRRHERARKVEAFMASVTNFGSFQEIGDYLHDAGQKLAERTTDKEAMTDFGKIEQFMEGARRAHSLHAEFILMNDSLLTLGVAEKATKVEKFRQSPQLQASTGKKRLPALIDDPGRRLKLK